jgi:flavin reductase (DIM6/NTAB) family NADH-FMN oxidoreductase RutF
MTVTIAAGDLAADEAYRLMSGVIVPRPIAWVTTLSARNGVNLAPFSCFTFLSNAPPMVGITIDTDAGQIKDTRANIEREGQFVVNIGNSSHLHAIHASSKRYPPDVSEAELLGLATTASHRITVPRLVDAPVSLECELRHVIPFGTGGAVFAVGEIVMFHLRDGLLADGKVDAQCLDPLGRVGGPVYARLGESFRLTPV